VEEPSTASHPDIKRPLNRGPTCEGEIALAARATGW
jgi:hypothetical protein